MQFAVHGSGDLLFGDGFAFWYTRDKGMDGVCVCHRSHMSHVTCVDLLHLPRSGPVFGSRDYFSGLGIFFDTYSNHNGPHDVSAPPPGGLVVGGLAVLTLPHPSPTAQHEHPFISAMVNNGTLHYDHDRDGTHSQISGCHCEFRAQQHSTYAIISYMDGVLAVSAPSPPFRSALVTSPSLSGPYKCGWN